MCFIPYSYGADQLEDQDTAGEDGYVDDKYGDGVTTRNEVCDEFLHVDDADGGDCNE